jgi:hypothetical protein
MMSMSKQIKPKGNTAKLFKHVARVLDDSEKFIKRADGKQATPKWVKQAEELRDYLKVLRRYLNGQS